MEQTYKIFKYEIAIEPSQKINVDGLWEVEKIAEQNGKLMIWCSIIQEEFRPTIELDIDIYATGQDINWKKYHTYDLKKTVVMSDGHVWHVMLNFNNVN